MRWVLLAAGGCTGGGAVPTPPDLPLDCSTPGHLCTVAGTGDKGFNGDGDVSETWLFLPTDVEIDIDGQPVLVDYNNMRLRRLEADGTIVTAVGSGQHAYATDGVDALQTGLENPIDLAIGADGVWYVMEQHSSRVLRVADGWLDVVAGDADNPGYEGFTGDGGPARDATMTQSVGLALAPDGTLFIADVGNHCIRMVSPDGVMGTLAGSGEEGFADGVGPDARFDGPHHLTWHDGLVYVADAFNHAVRTVDVSTGEVRTIAGTGVAGFSGDGAPAVLAQLNTPQGVAVDAFGQVLIADSENRVVRRIETDGTLTTWAGVPGEATYTGDGGPAAEATLRWPTNVTVGPDGSVYIADTLNSVVRVVAPG